MGGVFFHARNDGTFLEGETFLEFLRSRLQADGTRLITFYIASMVFKDRNLHHHNPFFAGFFFSLKCYFFPLKPAVSLVQLPRIRLVTNLLRTWGLHFRSACNVKGHSFYVVKPILN